MLLFCLLRLSNFEKIIICIVLLVLVMKPFYYSREARKHEFSVKERTQKPGEHDRSSIERRIRRVGERGGERGKRDRERERGNGGRAEIDQERFETKGQLLIHFFSTAAMLERNTQRLIYKF